MRRLALMIVPMLIVLVGCAQPGGTPGSSVSPPQAYAMWQAKPDQVHILDVRTPEEYASVGHAPMARNIPVKFMANPSDGKTGKPVWRPNPTFIQDVKKVYKPDDTILVMCGSGPRSQAAVKMMKDAGFTDVKSIEGGFEGQRGTDHGTGALVKPGWRNSGLPSTKGPGPDGA